MKTILSIDIWDQKNVPAIRRDGLGTGCTWLLLETNTSEWNTYDLIFQPKVGI